MLTQKISGYFLIKALTTHEKCNDKRNKQHAPRMCNYDIISRFQRFRTFLRKKVFFDKTAKQMSDWTEVKEEKEEQWINNGQDMTKVRPKESQKNLRKLRS